MKSNPAGFWAFIWTTILVGLGAAHATVTQQLEPARISMGGAANLTIVASGDAAQHIDPPIVLGLEFVAVGQSQRMESINGVTHVTASVTFRVMPRQPGVFNIPGAVPGAPPVVLTVTSRPTPPVAGTSAVPAEAAAYVHVHLAKHELFVGETIPVEIQVGTRDGVVTAMNGPPNFNGEGFVLDPLTSQPQRTTEMVDGEPFTVFTWHSSLSAVKPGILSLIVKSPLTIRERANPQNVRRFFDDPDDWVNDPNFRALFGGITERDISVASKPDDFTVQALPTEDRPRNFSGAVGQFTVTSEIADENATVGDPLTLRLKVAGNGNFARVDTPMVRHAEHWKSYAPTSRFKPDDETGATGEKDFEQPLVPTEPGEQPLPALSFSWFDPLARRYKTAHTNPLTAVVAPAARSTSMAQLPPAAPTGTASAAGTGTASAAGTLAVNAGVRTVADNLRPDHADRGGSASSLQPLYSRTAYVAIPSTLVALLSGTLMWLRRRERGTDVADPSSLTTERLLAVMDAASAAGDAAGFFRAARTVLQRRLAPQWHMAPEAITAQEVDAHFERGSDVARVFELADESAYAGTPAQSLDLSHWKRVIVHRLRSEGVS